MQKVMRHTGEETAFVIAHQRNYPSRVTVGSLETLHMVRNTLLAASNDRQWMCSSSGKAKFNSRAISLSRVLP